MIATIALAVPVALGGFGAITARAAAAELNWHPAALSVPFTLGAPALFFLPRAIHRARATLELDRPEPTLPIRRG